LVKGHSTDASRTTVGTGFSVLLEDGRAPAEGGEAMLLWEALQPAADRQPHTGTKCNGVALRSQRLPFDKRCIAQTKAGGRCRGRIQSGGQYCLFHDPAMTAERRRKMAAKAAQSRRRLSHLPDGYLRKLTSATAVGHAMDRLYREVRLGIITPEMGRVLFRILTRLLDEGLVKTGSHPERTKAARIRPKLRKLLTRAERAAWDKAVADAPAAVREAAEAPARPQPKTPFERAVARRREPQQPARAPAGLTLQAAS
jgi:hypothetical protein